MKDENNAKLYSPFDALSGFYYTLKQKEKVIIKNANVCDEYELKNKLRNIVPGSTQRIVYCWEGEFVLIEGRVEYISNKRRKLRICRREIAFDTIVSINE